MTDPKQPHYKISLFVPSETSERTRERISIMLEQNYAS